MIVHEYSPLACRSDQTVKAEMLLGASEAARFHRAFEKADVTGDKELTAGEAARACRGLGARATETEVKTVQRT